MRTVLLLVLVACLGIAGQVQADCGGSFNAASCGGGLSVRARPVRERLGSIMARITRPVARAGCSGAAVAGCSGSSRAVGCSGARSNGCSGSVTTIITKVIVPTATGCSGSSSVNSVLLVPVAKASYSDTDSLAQQSANYRAANGIKGHTRFEDGRMAGVGYSSFNSNPATCFNNMGGDYKVAQGRDGWYATRIIR